MIQMEKQIDEFTVIGEARTGGGGKRERREGDFHIFEHCRKRSGL